MNKKELRKQKLSLEKQKLKNDLRSKSDIKNFTADIWSEEELAIILIFNDIPELIKYIINIKNFIIPNSYPNDPNEAYKKYIFERREQHYLMLPEVYLCLHYLGFNIKNDSTQKLAMALTNHITTNSSKISNKLLIYLSNSIDNMHPYPSNLLKEIFSQNIANYPLQKSASIIINYLQNNPKISTSMELKITNNHK